jgi:head-tail adaptor
MITISAGRRIHRLTITAEGPSVPDGQGGFTRTPVTVAAGIRGEIKPATARDLERVIGSTVQATASHLVTIPYVAGVKTNAQVIFHDIGGDRTFSVTGVYDQEERHVELVLTCEETVSA